MSDALDHLESAIAEVANARTLVTKGKSAQVRSADERDKLKAVAFAWFKTHRAHVGFVDLAKIDQSYQTILDATDRNAARATYSVALLEAKSNLISLRREVTKAPPSLGPGFTPSKTSFDLPPAFASLTMDVSMQAILNRRWEEVQQCMAGNANLAATVMMGGLLETLLLARFNIVQKKAPIFTAKGAPKDKSSGKPLPLHDWKLINMVEVAFELSWISKSAKDIGNVLRDFRNYIHPHKEHTDGVVIAKEDALVFWEVCKSISRQILNSVTKVP